MKQLVRHIIILNILVTISSHLWKLLMVHRDREHGSPPKIPVAKYANHNHLIRSITFAYAGLTTIPDDFFNCLPSVTSVQLSQNHLSSLPRGVGKCVKLHHLDISNNSLTELPEDFADGMQNIRILRISNNPLRRLPPSVVASPVLEELYANAIGIEELPDAFCENSALTLLNLAENALQHLPPSFIHLTKILDLDLSGVKWTDSFMFMTRDLFDTFVKSNPLCKHQVSFS
jgi:Leucine-rich repeat (LRR) protein